MLPEQYTGYLETLNTRLVEQGFAAFDKEPEGGADRVWHRRKAEITKFSLVDCFACVRYVPGAELTTDFLAQFSSASFVLALANKSWLPRGLFGMAIALPLVITDQVSDDVAAFVRESYCPKHWASQEFPAVLELGTGKLLRFEKTPAWGAAYYKGMRKGVDALFSPK